MRALVLDGTGFDHLAVRRVPVPRPGPGQLLARVDAAGICTSLLKLIAQGADHGLVNGWDPARFPLILGDEGSVTLVEVGSELTDRFSPGQRCVVQPAVDHPPMYHPERYHDGGRGMLKVAVGYTLPGHLAEYVLLTEEAVRAGCVIPLSDASLPFAHAAIAEPLSCCVSSQDHHVHLVQDAPGTPRRAVKGLHPGGVTVIIGAGAMGRMHVDVAMAAGPRAIVSVNRGTERLRLVERLFARRAAERGVELHAVSPRECDLTAFVADLTDGCRADDVIVAVGSRPAIESAQALCGRGAVLNLFGGLRKGEHRVELDTGIVHYKEINVTGSSGGSPWDIRRALKRMAAGDVQTAAHITRIGDLEHAPDFLRAIKRGELDGKAVVYPHRRAPGIRRVESWSAEDEAEYLNEPTPPTCAE
jgi:threonine dehydrogenase-like Zn-dependent dehydrogenase